METDKLFTRASMTPRLATNLVLIGCLLAVTSGCFPFKRYKRHPDAEQTVARLVNASDEETSAARDAVMTLGAGAMPDIRDALPEAPTEAKIKLLEAAASIGKPGPVFVEIIELASIDPDPGVRQTAAYRAGGFPSLAEDLAIFLRPLLNDPTPQVRGAAVSSLGAFAPPNTVSDEELVALTRDNDVLVASNAVAIAVKRTNPELKKACADTLPRLVKALEDPAPSMRATVLFALGQLGSSAQSEVKAITALMMREKVPEVKLQAALTLVRIGTPAAKRAALPALRTMTKNPNQMIAGAARDAIKMAQAPAPRA